jgi:gluconolactonase
MDLDLPLSLDEVETFAEGLDHAEGLCQTLDGVLYAGGEEGQIYRIEPDGSPTEIWRSGGFMLGLAADAADRLYAVDTAQKCVWRLDLKSGVPEQFAVGPPERPFSTANWGAFGPDGTYYLSDSGQWGVQVGCLWRVPPGGQAEIWSEECRAFPNGLAVSPDGSRLYVLESYPGALATIEIEADGSPGRRQLLCEMDPAVPDGLALGTDGSILISCYRPDAIYHWSEGSGGLRVFAEDPRGTIISAPTNIALVGPQRDQVVVTNLGRWHLSRMPAGMVGERLHYPTIDLLGG